jgi:hypothetical protein
MSSCLEVFLVLPRQIVSKNDATSIGCRNSLLPDFLKVPEGTAKLYLPLANMPVLKLIKFNLPPLHKATAFLNPTDYLSEYAPTVTDFDPGAIPVPPSAVVKALGHVILTDKEIKSIVLVHSPRHRDEDERYPPWLATIWSTMERVRDARTLWRTAADRIYKIITETTTSQQASARAKRALELLDELPWTGDVKGLKAGGSINGLALWFTTDWLTTDHEDGMLEILADDLGLSDSSENAIQSTYFVHGLAQAYANPDMYRTARKFQWLRRLGQAFVMKERRRLGTIVNKDEAHWVGLTIDCEKETVGYGDGFGRKVAAELQRHVDWWLVEHLGVKFRWIDLPIPMQTDTHLCGLLAYSALANFFDGEHFPLPKATATSMADERVKMFLRIAERHNSKVYQ